jgi:hypothetical protein
MGIYSSVPEAEADSLVRIIQHARRVQDEKLQETRKNIMGLGFKGLLG